MAPESPYSSYERYKADTDFVAAWLASTAERCGYPSPAAATPIKAPRLKGKARLKARKMPYEADTSQSKSYVVKAHDYVPLALHIATSIANPTTCPVIVSVEFSQRLRRAIRLRKQYQKWHDLQGTGVGTAHVQDGHGYFIKVLEQVHVLLQCGLVADPEQKPVKHKGVMDHVDLANPFEKLVVEELEENIHDDEVREEHITTDVPETTNTSIESRDEASLAVWCLFGDIHRIRAMCRYIWKSYRRGAMDLVTAAIITNTAIDFGRNLQTAFDAMFPTRVELYKQVCIFCAYEHATSGLDASHGFEPCLVYPRQILDNLVRDLLEDPLNYVPTVAPQHLEIHDPSVQRATAARRELLFQDFKLAMGVIPEYLAMTMISPQHQAEHELCRGLRELVEQKQTPFWLTFALQVFLDMRHILREHVNCAFDDLCYEAETITSSIKQVLEFHVKISVPNAVDSLNKTLTEVLDLIGRWTQEDTIGSRRREMALDPTSSDHIPDYYLLRRDPLWCGLLLYNSRTVAYESAIIVANSWSSIIATAHLYNCLRAEKLLSRSWVDMDAILLKQGVGNVFVGSLPTTTSQCAKQFALSFGMSPVNFARNLRRLATRQAREQVRGLEKQAPVSWAFKHRYCDSSGRVDTKPQDIRDILARTGTSTVITALDDPKTLACDLLIHLAIALQRETLEMTFDYFQMHMISWDILRSLEKRLAPGMRDWCEVRQDDERTLPCFVFYLLCRDESLSLPAQRRLLCQAGDLLDHTLASEGRLVTAKREEAMTLRLLRALSITNSAVKS